MNTKVLLTALVTAIIGYFMGWLIMGYALMEFMGEHTMDEAYPGLMKMVPGATPSVKALLAMFGANFSISLLMTWILWKFGSRTFGSGFMNGAIIGFLFALFIDLFFYAMMNLYTPTYFAVDIIVNVLMFGVLSGIAAWMLGKMKAPAAA